MKRHAPGIIKEHALFIYFRISLYLRKLDIQQMVRPLLYPACHTNSEFAPFLSQPQQKTFLCYSLSAAEPAFIPIIHYGSAMISLRCLFHSELAPLRIGWSGSLNGSSRIGERARIRIRNAQKQEYRFHNDLAYNRKPPSYLAPNWQSCG